MVRQTRITRCLSPLCTSAHSRPVCPLAAAGAEEKVDGANLGISFAGEAYELRLQKRGHWITPSSEAQYAKLGAWLDK